MTNSVTFSASVGGDGSTVTDDNNATTGLDDGGYRDRFVPALSQTVAVAGFVVTTAATVASNAAAVAAATPLQYNACVNGSMVIAQRQTAATLTNSYLIGKCDAWAGKVSGGITGPSAGTLTQATGQTWAQSNHALHFSGVTSGDSATIIYASQRIAARDAAIMANKTYIFSCRVKHDVGSAKNYTIVIKKANSSNNFSATTTIGTSSAQSVTNDTDTVISYSVALGDCSNGLEIEIQCACGAITTKNFYISDAQLTPGSAVITYRPQTFEVELARARPYYCKSYAHSVAPGTNTNLGLLWFAGYSATTAAFEVGFRFPVEMAGTPTVVVYDIAGNANKVYRGGDNKTGSVVQASASGAILYVNDTTSNNGSGAHYTATFVLY